MYKYLNFNMVRLELISEYLPYYVIFYFILLYVFQYKIMNNDIIFQYTMFTLLFTEKDIIVLEKY